MDAATWRFHAGWLAALALALTGVWLLLRPHAHHDLRTEAFIAPLTIVAYGYLVLYAFALILLAICYTMLTIKRLRDRHRPTGLAGAVPLLVLLAASLHFMREQTPDVILLAYVVALDAALAAAIAWTVVELGFDRGR